MSLIQSSDASEPTERQREVLDAVLALLVEEGDAVTMSAVARRASCSKETLYKWFGDRDGLMTATVRWQASKVRAGSYDRQHLDASTLAESLDDFAANWLAVISSGTSIALNRVAVGNAAAGKADLGRIVLANGRFAIGERRTFFGLVGRDVQIRLLLGDRMALGRAEIERDAALATRQFLKLFGPGETRPKTQAN